MSVGAIANSSSTTRDAVHVKESRGIGHTHTHVAVERTADAEARDAAIDVHDHPVFDTPVPNRSL